MTSYLFCKLFPMPELFCETFHEHSLSNRLIRKKRRCIESIQKRNFVFTRLLIPTWKIIRSIVGSGSSKWSVSFFISVPKFCPFSFSISKRSLCFESLPLLHLIWFWWSLQRCTNVKEGLFCFLVYQRKGFRLFKYYKRSTRLPNETEFVFCLPSHISWLFP